MIIYGKKVTTLKAVWIFSGLLLLITSIIYFAFCCNPSKSENTVYIEAPKKGDIYEVKNEGHYSLYKVDQVINDSVFVLVNEYEIDRLTGMMSVKKGDEAYSTEALMILKTDLKTMLDTGEILNVYRK